MWCSHCSCISGIKIFRTFPFSFMIFGVRFFGLYASSGCSTGTSGGFVFSIMRRMAATSLSRSASICCISFRFVLPFRSFLYAFRIMFSSSIRRYKYLYCLTPLSGVAFSTFRHSSFLRINNTPIRIFFLLSSTHGRCDRFTVRPVSS